MKISELGALLLALVLACTPTLAKKRSKNSPTTDQSQKTVRVRSYKRKSGTEVDSYNRRPPGTAEAKKSKKDSSR